ncbi:MAG: hypothetical protein KDA44_03965 [Planctomycetales bacterium]|nr:hypothetical protein [Planctomycetales bacterium]
MASLDGPLAAKLMAELPPGDVRRVEAELDRLDEIDPAERAAVLAEFRGAVGQHGAAQPWPESAHEEEDAPSRRSVGGVEADFSAESEAAADAPPSARKAPATPANPLESAAPATIAQLLADEHPQTVAIILSRLSEERAGDVFALLDPELQTIALDRLAALDEADAEALMEVERQLTDRLTAHQRDQARMAAGANLALRMLAKTDPARRATLLTRLSLGGAAHAVADDSDPDDGAAPDVDARGNVSAPPTAKPATVRGRLLAALGRHPVAATPVAPQGGSVEVDADADELEFSDVSATLPSAAELCARLASLQPHALAAALGVVGERTAQLALVASGSPLVNRLTARLPRRQATALKKQLATVGPTSLAELCAAQARVLGVAEQLTDSDRNHQAAA